MEMLRSIFSLRMLCVFLLGFSSGLPLLLIGSTLKVWLREYGLDLTTIGFFAWLGFPYTLKFLWSPLMDRYTLPFLDRRRGWILVFQLALVAALFAMGLIDPGKLGVVAALAFVIAFLSASQDVAIDAYRREVLSDLELGLGASMGVNGYRLGMLLAGAGALLIADNLGWRVAYFSMAAAMGLSTAFTLMAPRVAQEAPPPRRLIDAVVLPFVEYFKRKGAIEMLLFILLFKIGDQMASDMLSPFYVDMQFTKTEIGLVSKLYGFWAVIIGGVLGGIVILKLGVVRSLWTFGIIQALSTAGFALLAKIGHSVPWLAAVITFENLSSGMGTAAYVAFMGMLSNRRFTATQYALLSSLMGVPRVFFGGWTGLLADRMGWYGFFLFCTLIAIPGLVMLLRAPKWQTEAVV